MKILGIGNKPICVQIIFTCGFRHFGMQYNSLLVHFLKCVHCFNKKIIEDFNCTFHVLG